MAGPLALRAQGYKNPTTLTYHERFQQYKWTPPSGTVQSAYQVQVNTQADFGGVSLWDSAKTASTNCYVLHGGSTPTLNTTYHWRVRVWDALDVVSDWSTGTFRCTRYALVWSTLTEYQNGDRVNTIVKNDAANPYIQLTGPPYPATGTWTSKIKRLTAAHRAAFSSYLVKKLSQNSYTPAHTSMVCQVQVGSTPTYAAATWTDWKPIHGCEDFCDPGIDSSTWEYMRVKVTLSTSNSSVTPQLR